MPGMKFIWERVLWVKDRRMHLQKYIILSMERNIWMGVSVGMWQELIFTEYLMRKNSVTVL